MKELMDSISPALLAAIGLPAIALIVWLVRGEGKTNTNTKCLEDLKLETAKQLAEQKVDTAKRIADIKIDHAKELVDLKTNYDQDLGEIKNEMKDTRERFFKHSGDSTIHHNAAAQLEFRKALDRRLDGLDEGVKDISRKLNHMAGRE